MCCWLPPAPGGRVTRRNHMMLTAIQHTSAEQAAATIGDSAHAHKRARCLSLRQGQARGVLVRTALLGTQSNRVCYPIVLSALGMAMLKLAMLSMVAAMTLVGSVEAQAQANITGGYVCEGNCTNPGQCARAY